MEFDILDALDDLGYSLSSLNILAERRCKMPNEDNCACLRGSGILATDEEIISTIERGTESIEFTRLVAWLSKELQALNNMESCINALTDPDDANSFLLEVRSFLRELHCPYKVLMNGPINESLSDVQSRKSLIDFLCTELQASRMIYSRKEVKKPMEIQMDATATALSLQGALNVLDIDVEKASSDSVTCLTEIENKVKQLLDTKVPDISPPIFTETMTEEQWASLSALYGDFVDDYTVRRKLLLTRLEVTVQSFNWGAGSRGKESKILNSFLPHRKLLKDEPAVKLSDVIAARESLLVLEKTSSANLVKNTKSSVNRILIPAVPDRGGRPKEQRPPVEMPNWMKRSQGGDNHGGRGGGHWQGKGKKFRGNQGGGGDKGHKKGGGGGKGHKKGGSGNFDAAGFY